MTQDTDKRPPWYGGNKIPKSYLEKFKIPSGPEQDKLPYELRLFLQGNFK